MSRAILVMGGLLPAEREDLARDFEVLRLHRESDPDGLLRERQRDIVGLITWITNPVSRALIEALPNLEIIGRVGAGVDNIDLEVARARGIVVVNTPDLVTADTADLAMGLIVALLRRTVEADAWVRVGKWRGGAMPLGASLTGKRLGIVGLGRIGQALARRAQAFDMTVLYHGPRRKPDAPYRYVDDLCALAAQSDVLLALCDSDAPAQSHSLDRACDACALTSAPGLPPANGCALPAPYGRSLALGFDGQAQFTPAAVHAPLSRGPPAA